MRDITGPVHPYDLCCSLLDVVRACRDARCSCHDQALLFRDDEVTSLASVIRAGLRPVDASIDAATARWMEEEADHAGLPACVTARSVAHAIDDRCWDGFTERWTERLPPDGLTLSAGDLYPVTDWQGALPGDHRSPRPDRQHVRRDELAHIRRWHPIGLDDAPVRVTVHLGGRAVDAAAEAASAASLHTLGSLDELTIGAGTVFPISPRATRGSLVVRLLEQLRDGQPGLVVGGELGIAPEDVATVQRWFDTNPLAAWIIVPGTTHERIGEEPTNVGRALRPGSPPWAQTKARPYLQIGDHGVPTMSEGITPRAPHLHIWVGSWARFAMAICADLLSPSVREALERVGANLLAFPVLTDDLDAHATYAAAICTATQGRALVANALSPLGSSKVVAAFCEPAPWRRPVLMTSPESAGAPGAALVSIGGATRWVGGQG